jgi:hypothetical protein
MTRVKLVEVTVTLDAEVLESLQELSKLTGVPLCDVASVLLALGLRKKKKGTK